MTRCTDLESAGAERLTATRWGYALLGKTATDALLYAAISRATKANSAQNIAWAKANYENSVRIALAGTPAERFLLDSLDLSGLEQSYADAIGDQQQILPGEDHRLDQMLRKEVVNPDRSHALHVHDDEPVATLSVPATPSEEVDATVEGVSSFVVQWFATELKLPVDRINVDRSFFDYGLDSVTAVMLSAALEDHLHVNLPAEIAYDFPVIRALAVEIARRLQDG